MIRGIIMKKTILRKALIGYDKGDVLMKLDGINTLVADVRDNLVSKPQALAEAQQIAASPIRTAFFNSFKKSDVDNYVRQLVAQLAAL